MLTCREIIDFLMDYQNDELEPGVRDRFDEHIAVCPPCVAFMRTYEETIKLGKAAMKDPCNGHEDIPPELVQAILKARNDGN